MDPLEEIPVRLPRGPFEPTWDSLKRYEVPQWYRDAKFGIFIHWGAYSVPAFGNEWYPRNMYIEGHPAYEYHLKTYGPHREFGYKDFIPMFTAEEWDPDEWARLFRRAGARYVVLVAEHHDGFALWDCSYTRWSAARMGPRRDVVRELAEAVRDQGLVFGVSYHRAEHWWFFEPGTRFDSDVRDPRFLDLYGPAKPASLDPFAPPSEENVPPDREFLVDWLLRALELVDKYRPQLFYFDWWINNPAFEPYLRFFAAYYYNRAEQWDVGVVINYKIRAFPEGAAVLTRERGTAADIEPRPWQVDTSVCKKSWGYIRDHDYKPVSWIIHDMVDVVSKNGCYLLNIAPRPDGTIPEEQRRILSDVGGWLSINGEAIYGARPWRVYGEGPTRVPTGQFTDVKRPQYTHRDVRFTVRRVYPYGDVLYATFMGWPEDGVLEIRSLGTGLGLLNAEVEFVELLGSREKLEWSLDETGLRVKLPGERPCQHAYTLKIVFKKPGAQQ